jgi:ribosomal protein S18 acetylase RimI-like enzyme
MMSGVAVRPYSPADRTVLEDVAYRVGFMGESSDAFWRHRASANSIWMAPYLDGEPESTFVGLWKGEVMGYLTGCVDTARFVGPDAVMMQEVSRHKLLFRPGVAGFFWRAIKDTVVDRLHGRTAARGELHDARWPSHLHVNLLREARGVGLGRALMEAWLSQLERVGSPGCHLGTILENERAVRFFEAMGFERHGAPQLLAGLRNPTTGERLHQQMMVRTISSRAPA